LGLSTEAKQIAERLAAAMVLVVDDEPYMRTWSSAPC
jgi:hypothetical protein